MSMVSPCRIVAGYRRDMQSVLENAQVDDLPAVCKVGSYNVAPMMKTYLTCMLRLLQDDRVMALAANQDEEEKWAAALYRGMLLAYSYANGDLEPLARQIVDRILEIAAHNSSNTRLITRLTRCNRWSASNARQRVLKGVITSFLSQELGGSGTLLRAAQHFDNAQLLHAAQQEKKTDGQGS